MNISKKDTVIIRQSLQNQFDMESDMFHDNAWLNVNKVQQLATKPDSEINDAIIKMRKAYDTSLDRLLTLQRFLSTVENS